MNTAAPSLVPLFATNLFSVVRKQWLCTSSKKSVANKGPACLPARCAQAGVIITAIHELSGLGVCRTDFPSASFIVTAIPMSGGIEERAAERFERELKPLLKHLPPCLTNWKLWKQSWRILVTSVSAMSQHATWDSDV
jgi:hypothetical protein